MSRAEPGPPRHWGSSEVTHRAQGVPHLQPAPHSSGERQRLRWWDGQHLAGLAGRGVAFLGLGTLQPISGCFGDPGQLGRERDGPSDQSWAGDQKDFQP